ncbi:MAG: CatB-related O-acetyltransferase [Bacteroidetes bacterium]|nr:CatB-related O-acetyltransferase [Bacteroidota bacterium]
MIKNWIRRLFSSLLKDSEDFKLFKQLAHPQGIHLENSTISEKSKVQGPARLVDTVIGSYCYISENAKLSKNQIGKFCSIGPNLISGYGIHPIDGISTSPMFYSTGKQNGMTLSESDKIEERKTIVIGNDVFIGMNVTILDGITIGDGAVIGAGAVVSKNIPAYAIAVGNPIQIIRYRFSDEQIASLLKIKWWDFSEDKLVDVEKSFFDIDAFISKHLNA